MPSPKNACLGEGNAVKYGASSNVLSVAGALPAATAVSYSRDGVGTYVGFAFPAPPPAPPVCPPLSDVPPPP